MPLGFEIRIDGTLFDLPQNWREVAYDYDFNGIDTFVSGVTGQMQFCGREPYTTTLAQLNESLCGISVVEWQVICSPLVPFFIEIFTGNVRRSDYEHICGKTCEVRIQAEQVNGYTILEENQGTEVCVPCGDPLFGGAAQSQEITVHQMQTGATYKEADGVTEREFCFMRVVDYLHEMVNRLGWTTGGPSPVNSFILNRPFLTDNREIVVPNANDTVITIFLEYETGFQKNVTINVDPTDTLADVRLLIQKGILAINSYGIAGFGTFSPQWDEFQFQPADVFIGAPPDPANINPELRSDHPIRNLIVTGDVNGAYTITQNQAYQYGLENLLISTNGLETGGNASICCSWSEMKDLLTKIHPMVIGNNSNNGLTIESYDDAFNNRVPGTPSDGIFGTPLNGIIEPEGGVVKSNVRPEILFSRAFFGQSWEIEDLQDCLDSWQWEGTGVAMNVVGDQSGGYAGNQTTFLNAPIVNGGSYTISGEFTFGIFGPGSPTFKVDILDNAGGNVLATGTFVTISAGDVVRSVDQMFGTKSFCLAAGDNPVLRWESSPAAGVVNVIVAPATTFLLSQSNADADFPYIRDDTSHLADPYVDLQLFGDCEGIFDKAIPDRSYAGLGFAIDQQINGCKDYGDAVFLTFLDDALGDTTRRFPRSMYFDTNDLNVTQCYRGSLIRYYYHNSPLMWPQIAYEFRNYLPSDLVTGRYTQTVTLNSNGTGAEPTIAAFARNYLVDNNVITRGHDRTNVYEFEVCQTILNTLARSLDRAVTFFNCFTEQNQTGIIRKMSTRFDGQGKSVFIVEAAR